MRNAGIRSTTSVRSTAQGSSLCWLWPATRRTPYQPLFFAGFSFISGGGGSQAAAGSGQSSAETADQAGDDARREGSGQCPPIPPEEDVEPGKPVSANGVDSLMAVELRNWVTGSGGSPARLWLCLP
ncbi:hypothetical protein KVR01_005485 [Diaporthe batatas]|uniref:uncharacterized protein n=1 Tax=Diaporthe batatas TaxID=748121 RepID=UPI001D03D3CD|nr:uncharacterized protein KVR01_005485 [Diaporthe batatas]KAG8165210.1 hypothetical protein KVR01_005485 [Diaporthe batatas]